MSEPPVAHWRLFVRKHASRALSSGPGKLLRFNTKYDSIYYLIETLQDAYDACLERVKENAESGFYYEPKKPTGELISVEDLAAPLRATAINHNKRVKAEAAQYQEDILEWEILQLALKGDAEAAVYLIMQRKDYEYEGWGICHIQNR